MITLSNGKKFKKAHDLDIFLAGMGLFRLKLLFFTTDKNSFGDGVRHAIATAIAAIDVAIENAELALKSAQRKEDKMKAAKKPAVKKVAKPVAKKAVKKPIAKKK